MSAAIHFVFFCSEEEIKKLSLNIKQYLNYTKSSLTPIKTLRMSETRKMTTREKFSSLKRGNKMSIETILGKESISDFKKYLYNVHSYKNSPRNEKEADVKESTNTRSKSVISEKYKHEQTKVYSENSKITIECNMENMSHTEELKQKSKFKRKIEEKQNKIIFSDFNIKENIITETQMKEQNKCVQYDEKKNRQTYKQDM